jgi:hypothetical protein
MHMITAKDIVSVPVEQADVDYAKTSPIGEHKHAITGQLKTLGTLAMMRVLGVSPGAYKQQQASAEYLNTTYVCQGRDGKKIGLTPAVLFVRDGNVMTKSVIVPANQLFKHNYLDEHHTVAVFVVGDKDENGELTTPRQISVAGWIPSGKLKRWIAKDGKPPFTAKNVSLAVAPCQILMPMQYLLNEVSHHDARV